MSTKINFSDGRDALDSMFEKLYTVGDIGIVAPCRCKRSETDICDSVLTNIIKQKIENKAVPLVMRKRMLYEQARAS